MSKLEKFLLKILKGQSDHNINFQELCSFLKYIGFKEKIKGSHHIYTYDNVDEIINIQPENNKAKAYQIRQIRKLILKYKLGGNIHE